MKDYVEMSKIADSLIEEVYDEEDGDGIIGFVTIKIDGYKDDEINCNVEPEDATWYRDLSSIFYAGQTSGKRAMYEAMKKESEKK